MPYARCTGGRSVEYSSTLCYTARQGNWMTNRENGTATMLTLKITAVGDSTGVVLPREVLERLRVGEGDTLYAMETPRGVELLPNDPEFLAQMEVAEQVMREDREALKKLAG
jgi:putative addiction module antidote